MSDLPARRDVQEEAASGPAAGAAPSDEEDGDALILWMLGLTPTQRLEVAQGFVDSVLALRHGSRP